MAATITSLPHEIIVDILSRLPIKHLSPLRFVSKTWLKLLTIDYHFAKLHFDRVIESNFNLSILVNRKNKSFPGPADFHLATEYTSCDKAIKLEASFDNGVDCSSLKFENPYQGLQIWAMKEYGVVSSWTKQFKVVKPEVSERFFGITPLGMLAHNGEYVIEDGSTELILYNSKSNLAEKLKGFGFKFTDAYSYIGSIISPRVISGAHET